MLTVTFASNNAFKLYFSEVIRIIFTMRAEFVHFNEITNRDEFWDYMENDFLNTLHIFLLKWENKSVPVNFKADNENFVLGPPRIRQIRIKSTKCQGDSFHLQQLPKCFGPYSPKHEDTAKFFKGSKYYTASEAGFYTNIPLIFDYHAGGYIVNLDFNKEDSRKIIQKLRDSDWIDRGTRLVIVEMGFFNGNLKLYCEAKYV